MQQYQTIVSNPAAAEFLQFLTAVSDRFLKNDRKPKSGFISSCHIRPSINMYRDIMKTLVQLAYAAKLI